MTGWGAVEVPCENHRSSGDGSFESAPDNGQRRTVFALFVRVVVEIVVEDDYWAWGGSEEERGGCVLLQPALGYLDFSEGVSLIVGLARGGVIL